MNNKKQNLDTLLTFIRFGNNIVKAANSIEQVGKAALYFHESMSDLSQMLNKIQIESQMCINLRIKEYTLGLTILEKQRLYGNL